ncbi:MAG: alanine--tRNA ligase [Candidatus Komeilibacteria bacterium RIFCSPLOWO2_01_FULL_52_15]|uniref:Alanine--tRNA ligase n=2 Tax=Candidatus Komeiliibacteriota TaxID=1817908 RepID=A0A1G2BMR7_9BACT|nr:MAG: alanine--tRNA ligase [Candidatus Komeilibacteria bacterium RIFCSPHIGHO2_01_FULL_52_14]OGY90422.1 MAG: alanine--tRNA ligase [Candidatus Komeilibacteria bacterium RIFCSPLOWO2_01_FULL_52_15]
MTSKQLKHLYFKFFQDRGHKLIPSASLVPENDPTVLFTPAGMHPLTPFLMGEKHPQGTRLVDAQKCIRTSDIDDVGDASHLTFFEMLGNWSLGDYFKKESIAWSYEFLTDKKYLGFDPSKLWVTVFAGEDAVSGQPGRQAGGRQGIPRDEESAGIWKSLGIPVERVLYFPRKDNFWGPVGETGPCGPDTEIFVDTGKDPCGPNCGPGCGCGKYFEVWNNVFMEFERTKDGRYIPLKQKNVDTGMGVERTVAMLDGAKTVYEIDTFQPLVKMVRERSAQFNEKSMHIIVDHVRAAVFLLADERGVKPSNVDQGYVLRRLIRRMIRHAKMIGFDLDNLPELAKIVIREYHVDYPELVRNVRVVEEELIKEKDKFLKTLEQGIKAFEKSTRSGSISGKDAFVLFSSYGFPLEMVQELAAEKKISVDVGGFQRLFEEHQEKSRTAAAGKFKGGLADHGEMTTKYHTANHMMLEALKRVLGRDVVNQKGSNITAERLRFDFTYPGKMTAEQIRQVEDIVNGEIKKNHPVHFEEMSVAAAKQIGATGVFEHKYSDTVKVYFVGDYSTEICGGPHVQNTKGMGLLKIVKEEASSAGVRRIKAVLTPDK